MAKPGTPSDDLAILAALERKVLWLASWTIHNANHLRENIDGLKVGGHQASSRLARHHHDRALFRRAAPQDRVAVKPHATPIFHAIQYLLGKQTREKLERFRGYKGAQSYPSRTKDTDDVDFSTGSVGLGVAQTLFSSLVQDYVRAHGWGIAAAGRPHGRAGRRCRARRGQYLRGDPGRLEAGPAQLLVDHRLQPPEPRRGGARRPVGSASRRCSATSAGTSSSSNTARCSEAAFASRAARACATGSTTAPTSSIRRWCSTAARPGASG